MVRREDAPVAGWYPDPRNRMVLRWWDGLDWTEARRAPPSDAELLAHRVAQQDAQRSAAILQAASNAPVSAPGTAGGGYGRPASTAAAATSSVDTRQVVEEVRNVARSEIDRAADLFTQRARAMQRDITPLVSEYTNRIIRWVRFAVIAAVVLLVAYFVFQVIAQASLFDWIGDRIDNIFDNDGSG